MKYIILAITILTASFNTNAADLHACDAAGLMAEQIMIVRQNGRTKHEALTAIPAEKMSEPTRKMIELAYTFPQEKTEHLRKVAAVNFQNGLAKACWKQVSAASEVFKDCPNCPEMVVIPAGSFEMGSSDTDSEKPVHTVRVSSFALAKTEVTQGQWRALMGRESPVENLKDCDDCPVAIDSRDDMLEFLQRLSQNSGQRYRLPSEAEWEYACKAGGNDKYCGGNDLNSVGWHNGNSGGRPHPVSQKQANRWGLYDMTGNAWEWVADCRNSDYNGAPTDGTAWATGQCSFRMLRGGCFGCKPESRHLHATNRNFVKDRSSYQPFVGFRVAR
jgi:formylglycine-generating enzyme required for sulfatase activity